MHMHQSDTVSFKNTPDTDFEVRTSTPPQTTETTTQLLRYALVGVLFGVVFVKAEIISWYRIQEMFRLQSFHMFGVIGTAVAVGATSVFLLKKLKINSLAGEPITLESKSFNRGQIYGGLLFGFGWAMTGACPGPLFAQIGTGAAATVVTLFSAIVGTWVYGWLRERLPH
jgi:uncharacterized protein